MTGKPKLGPYCLAEHQGHTHEKMRDASACLAERIQPGAELDYAFHRLGHALHKTHREYGPCGPTIILTTLSATETLAGTFNATYGEDLPPIYKTWMRAWALSQLEQLVALLRLTLEELYRDVVATASNTTAH